MLGIRSFFMADTEIHEESTHPPFNQLACRNTPVNFKIFRNIYRFKQLGDPKTLLFSCYFITFWSLGSRSGGGGKDEINRRPEELLREKNDSIVYYKALPKAFVSHTFPKKLRGSILNQTLPGGLVIRIWCCHCHSLGSVPFLSCIHRYTFFKKRCCQN